MTKFKFQMRFHFFEGDLKIYVYIFQAVSELDMESIFLTDIIHESLLRDSFNKSQALEPDNELFTAKEIRHHLNGILSYKAPALFRTLKLVLNKNLDVIKHAARVLLRSR